MLRSEKFEEFICKYEIHMEPSPENKDPELSRYIDCIGVDNLQHVCLPESSQTKCNVTVKRKTLLRDDRILHFCCYECTF